MTQPPPLPEHLNYAQNPSNVKAIAKYQRAVMLCILAYLCMLVGQFFLPPDLRIVLGIAVLGVSITATVFVFLLATQVYSTGMGVLMGILTLIPCVGLIVLLIVNGKATAILRQNGLKAGLLGATVPD